MDMRRGDKAPFYFAPGAKRWIQVEDKIIEFADHLVDAHEEERNRADFKRSFYERTVYAYDNFFRYSNPTLGNLMFDT